MDERDDAVSLILYGCKLAREFESNLSHLLPNEPHFLIPPCEDIVRVFNDAMVLLGSHSHNRSPPPPPPPYGFMFIGESSEQQNELGVAGAQDLFMGSHTEPMDLIHALGTGVLPGSEMGMEEMPEMGFEGPVGSTKRALEHELGGMQMGSARSAVEERNQGLRGRGDHVQAMEMEQSDCIRSPTVRGPSLQRSRSTRKDGRETFSTFVPAPSPLAGNAEMAPEDGATWRKYGQKVILHSRFPRSYYRCAHKNCDARKKVQRLDDEPYIYEVTYQGRHTCQAPLLLLLPPSSSAARAMAAGTGTPRAQALPSASASIRLGGGVSAGSEFEVDQRVRNVPPKTHVRRMQSMETAETSSARVAESSHVQDVNELEGILENMADFMFNSGSSDNSMDSIFSPKPKEDN